MTVYYIHQDLCQEIKTLTVTTAENISKNLKSKQVQHQNPNTNYPMNYPIIRTKNVTVVPHQDSLTLTWHIDVKNNTTTADSSDITVGGHSEFKFRKKSIFKHFQKYKKHILLFQKW